MPPFILKKNKGKKKKKTNNFARIWKWFEGNKKTAELLKFAGVTAVFR